MEDILAVLDDPELRTVAVVGCSKNSGKTTALNHVLAGLGGTATRVGLMSIGIDGEEADFWLGVPKPRVSVREGWLVATADKVLKSGTAQVRTVARTGVVTPLGELVLGRVEKEGLLLLAGVRHKGDVRGLVDLMIRHGATRVLVDGSYQRLMSADPEVSDGIILATGAILGRTVAEVASRTQGILDRLLLPATDRPGDQALLAGAVRHRRPAVRDAAGRVSVLAGSGAATEDAEVRDALGKGDAVIALPGVVTDRLLRVLLAHRGTVRLVAADPTRLFTSAPLFNRFRAKGGEIVVGRGVRLLAIAVNPYSVLGYELPLEPLVAGIRALAPRVPVFSFHEREGDG